MNANTLLTIIMQRSDQLLVSWYWLALAGLAVIVAMALAPPGRITPSVARFVVAGWLVFAITHAMCQHWILKQWAVCEHALREAAGFRIAADTVRDDLATVVTAPHLAWVLPFHFLLDAVVLLAIVFMVRRVPAQS
jgi:hypothetical protein